MCRHKCRLAHGGHSAVTKGGKGNGHGGGRRKVVFVFGYVLESTWSHVVGVSTDLYKLLEVNHNTLITPYTIIGSTIIKEIEIEDWNQEKR
jgi:hypothetical protein